MEYSDVIWLEPWTQVEQEAKPLVAELQKESPPGHILEGKSIEAIARRIDNDDVLFEVKGIIRQYLVVHLTWTGHQEQDKRWPHVVFYPNLEAWIDQCMKPDHHEHLTS